MSRKSIRGIEAFSLSFLDVVTCGFGAIILLLVLSKFAEPRVIEDVREDLDKEIASLQEEFFDLRGETVVLNRSLASRKKQLSEEKAKLAGLRGDLSTLHGKFAASKLRSAVQNKIEGRFAVAQQELTEEMRRLLGAGYKRPTGDRTIGGVPVDSEYIIFVIDTSGSMFNNSWSLVLKKLAETLDIYPNVKGIQVMNDMGEYMFSQYRGKWIPDTAARRKAIITRLKTWNPFSNSSPVEGITRAVRSFYAPDKKISIYVFGDEFSGGSIQSVVEAVDRINKPRRDGRRLVRIHAVGFPVQFAQPSHLQITGIRFATLMRILCHKNGGTFVGLSSFMP